MTRLTIAFMAMLRKKVEDVEVCAGHAHPNWSEVSFQRSFLCNSGEGYRVVVLFSDFHGKYMSNDE